MSLIFHPAGEQEADAFRQLLKGYEAFRQKRYPIPTQAQQDWVHAVTAIRAPTSILQDEVPTSTRTRNIVFTRILVALDGTECDAEDNLFVTPVRERFYIWHNAEVWKAYQSFVNLQAVLSEFFTKELK